MQVVTVTSFATIPRLLRNCIMCVISSVLVDESWLTTSGYMCHTLLCAYVGHDLRRDVECMHIHVMKLETLRSFTHTTAQCLPR